MDQHKQNITVRPNPELNIRDSVRHPCGFVRMILMAWLASSKGAKTIRLAYFTVENNLPIGSAGNRPVKYNQSTALFKANSADAPAKMNRMVSLLPQILRIIEFLSTKYCISSKCSVQQ
jgi:hypothetical protein